MLTTFAPGGNSERLQHVGRKTPGYLEVLVDLILCDRIARSRTENSIDWTVVITELGELRLDGLDRGISHRRAIIGRGVIVRGRGVIVRLNASVVTVRIIINGRDVIVRLNVSVVIVRIVVAGVIRQVIPRVESGIQSEPEAVVKNKEPIVEEMGMPPVPVAVPISVMTFSDVVRSPVQSAVCNCSRWTCR